MRNGACNHGLCVKRGLSLTSWCINFSWLCMTGPTMASWGESSDFYDTPCLHRVGPEPPRDVGVFDPVMASCCGKALRPWRFGADTTGLHFALVQLGVVVR
ncbi:hypothetical protein N7468_001468 [Penicillium chermesinum]|uniref:Secreted protein n=1 Tax=Penicillium chermesinum TaxID=63820 RepID=A0A9W9PGQ6_9EURO|nr:uncharacterized protein N7468_001468 [Penicillium chermesinum]KAJ5246485.1 hypothetical protein N7468_001468 [Penicillium chermesinum]